MRRTHVPFVILFLLTSFFSSQSFPQKQKVNFVLREIIHNRVTSIGNVKYPDKVEVNTKGGFVEFTVNYSGNCSEKYRIEFSFDQDMSILIPNQTYGFTTKTRLLSRKCNDNRDAFIRAGAANGSSSGLLAGTKYVKDNSTLMNMGSGWDRLYTKGISRGHKTGILKGSFYPKYSSGFINRYTWLNFNIEAPSNLRGKENSFYYEFLFVYQVVKGGVPEATFDCPPPDCSGFPGTVPVWNFQTNKGECWCEEGYVWSDELKKCIPFKGKAR